MTTTHHLLSSHGPARRGIDPKRDSRGWYLEARAVYRAHDLAVPTYRGWSQLWIDFLCQTLEAQHRPQASLLADLQRKPLIDREDVLAILGRPRGSDLRGCSAPVTSLVKRLKRSGWLPSTAVPLMQSKSDGEERSRIFGYLMLPELRALCSVGATGPDGETSEPLADAKPVSE